MADDNADLWRLSDAASDKATAPRSRIGGRWLVDAVPIVVLAIGLAVGVMLPVELPMAARIALFSFGLATILWSLTRINAAYVALGAVLLLTLSDAIDQEALLETLESDVIWLMIGAFILGAAVEASGLSDRMGAFVSDRVRSVGGMLWLVAAMLVPLAFLIPSTSGRAAVSLPLFRSLSDAANDRAVTRALALLIPTIILVSTIGSLVGAGSHLIANDLLDESGYRLTFSQWAIYGLPFAIVASAAAVVAIAVLFLSPEQRRAGLRLPKRSRGKFSPREWIVIVVTLLMVSLWLTEGAHRFEIATVSIAGAFLITLPVVGAISWKQGLRAVSWNLVLFVGAALVLGESLISTGAAKWLIDGLFALTGIKEGGASSGFILATITLISLTSHLYMTSHSARTAALIPPFLYVAVDLGLEPASVMFIATVGINYCLTFPVSSKALLVFQEQDRPTFDPPDLLRLSAVMLPVHAVLMVIFYYGYWRHVGLALQP